MQPDILLVHINSACYNSVFKELHQHQKEAGKKAWRPDFLALVHYHKIEASILHLKFGVFPHL